MTALAVNGTLAQLTECLHAGCNAVTQLIPHQAKPCSQKCKCYLLARRVNLKVGRDLKRFMTASERRRQLQP